MASGEYEGEGALRVPVWPARVIVVIGAVLVVVSYALHAAERHTVARHRRAEESLRAAATTHL